MRLLFLAAAAAFLGVAYGTMPCPTCGQFCACVNKVAPSNLVSTAKLDAAYKACDSGDYPDYEGPDDPEDKKWEQYERCLMPPCAACTKTIETLYEMDSAGARRKKRSLRKKRQATGDDGDWEEWEKCVAKQLGMSQEDYELYEEQLAIGYSGVEVCYLLECGQTFKQMTTNDKACMKSAGISSMEMWEIDDE